MCTGKRIAMHTRCEVPSILCGYGYAESGSLGPVLLVCVSRLEDPDENVYQQPRASLSKLEIYICSIGALHRMYPAVQTPAVGTIG